MVPRRAASDLRRPDPQPASPNPRAERAPAGVREVDPERQRQEVAERVAKEARQRDPHPRPDGRLVYCDPETGEPVRCEHCGSPTASGGLSQMIVTLAEERPGIDGAGIVEVLTNRHGVYRSEAQAACKQAVTSGAVRPVPCSVDCSVCNAAGKSTRGWHKRTDYYPRLTNRVVSTIDAAVQDLRDRSRDSG